MIRVVFKKDKNLEYGQDKFTYADYQNAEVGDVVVANTRYGYAIAKVVEVNIEDERFNENNLATIEKVIKSNAEFKAEQAKALERKNLIKRFRRKKILEELFRLDFNEHDKNLIAEMVEEDLEGLYKEINKYK